MNQLIFQCQEKYGSKVLDYQEFCEILEQFALIDDRCQLLPQVLFQLFSILQEKQECQVTYVQIEILIFDYLIQQPNVSTLMKDSDLGVQTRKLTRSMIERVDQQMIKNLINFHKICQSRLQLQYDDVISYSDLNQLGNNLQNQLHLSTKELLTYIYTLRDENDMVKNSDIIVLINELEKAIYKSQKERISMRASMSPKKQLSMKDEDILNLSFDEAENKKTNNLIDEQSNSLTNQQKIQHYTNLLMKGLDYFKQQKQVLKMDDGMRIVNDMLKLVQKIEFKALEPYKWNDEKNRLVEELYIEKELIQIEMNSQQNQNKIQQEQIGQLLDDNDLFSLELTNKDTQIDKLKAQIIQLIQEGQAYSMLETETRVQQLNFETQKNKIIQYELEKQHLQSNNKTLLEIIDQLEGKQIDSNEQPIMNKQISSQNDLFQQENAKLTEIQEQMEQDVKQLNIFVIQLEGQISDVKREATHYKNLYENIKDDNIQFRNSLMRPSINFGGRESNVRNRLSNMGAYNIERQSQMGGRLSFNPRASNIGRNSNINQFQNGGKLNYPTISIGKVDSNNSDLVKKDQLQLINEEEQEEQYQVQQKEIGINFGNFWDKFVKRDYISNIHLSDNPQKGFQRPGYNPEYQFLQFDENILYERDYLGLRDDPKIIEIIKLEKQKYNQIMIKCYSDAVFRIDAKGQRSRRVLFSTEFNIYIFESEKNYKLTRQFPIDKLVRIIFSETSPILCCLIVKGSDDYLIETFKRVELNVYLTETLGQRKLPLYDLDFKVSFEVQFKGFRQPKKIEDLANGSYMGGSKQAAYKVSQKSGFLQMQTKKLFSKEWDEVFVMLCDVGLILFKKPGDSEPLLFVPIADALVIKNPKSVDKSKPNMIKVCYKTLEQEYLFAATSSALLDEWHNMINLALNAQFIQQSKQNSDQKTEIQSQRITNEQK